MLVPVVDVRVVDVGVGHRLVFVRVAVRLSRWVFGRVFVPVVFVVDVIVVTMQRLVPVLVYHNFKTLATESASPSMTPRWKRLPPRTVMRKVGSSGKIISLETSLSRLAAPSTLTLRGSAWVEGASVVVVDSFTLMPYPYSSKFAAHFPTNFPARRIQPGNGSSSSTPSGPTVTQPFIGLPVMENIPANTHDA